MPEIIVNGRHAMTVKDAAKTYGFSVRWLRSLIKKGKVEAYRVERAYLVYADSVEARLNRETKGQQVKRWIVEHHALSWTIRAIEDAMHQEGIDVELGTILRIRADMRRAVGWKYVSSQQRMRAGEAI